MKTFQRLHHAAVGQRQSVIGSRRSAICRAFFFTSAIAIIFSSHAAPLTLDDAIRFALQNNQALKVSAFTPDIARANVLAEYGAFDPAITFRRSYSDDESPVTATPLVRTLTQNDDYSLSFTGLTPWGATYGLTATADNQRGSFNRLTDNFVAFGGVFVTQPLLRGFGFGANLAGLRVARADRGVAEWRHRQRVIDTVTDVIVLYSSVIQAREVARIAGFTRSLSARLVQQNERRNQIGQISDADVLQARARLASREENILVAERSAADLENQLRQLLGETVYPVGGPPLELEPLPPAPSRTVEAAADLKNAFELRPDYQAARLGIVRSRVTTAFARNQLLPRVDFVGRYGYSGMDQDFGAARRQVRDRDVRAYSAGVVISVPLTFAEGRGRARAAKLSLQQTEADIVRLEQDIAVDVALAAGQIETTRQRVMAAENARRLAEQYLDAEQKKFTAGTTSTFLVIQAQDQLAVSQNNYARALADQRRALANYDREIGVTLLNRNIQVE